MNLGTRQWKTATAVSSSAAQTPLFILLEEKFISLLQSCNSHKRLREIQTQLVTNGLHQSRFVAPKLVALCAESHNMGYARRLFDGLSEPNDVVYNSMLKGYIQNGQYGEAVSLFRLMMRRNVKPTRYTFPMVLKSCGRDLRLEMGVGVHCAVVKNAHGSNPFVGTTLIEMYTSFDEIGKAYKVFGEMPVKNVVSWTSMVSGFIFVGKIHSARRLFELAPERDVVLWNAVISGYIKVGDMTEARELFSRMPGKDVMAWNTILNGYVNSGDMEAGEKFFEEMPTRNVFSWNGLMGGYVQCGKFSKVLSAFERMLAESEVQPNDATLVSVLSSCARLGELESGKWIHKYSESLGYKTNVFVANALMDMYAKCGLIENAVEVFNGLPYRDLITWNTIINGLAMHGRGSDALDLFSEMKAGGIKPDGITFIGVLCACTHLGLVEDGLSHFYSMADYSIDPEIEHYGCVIDLCARAGLLDRALEFVKKMPMEADCVIWSSLLGACRTHKNLELAELALKRLIELEPGNPVNHLMLSNIYGESGKWEKVSQLKVAMRDTGFRKAPGSSLVVVNDEIVEFYSLDERHPETQEIYGCLRSLNDISRQLDELEIMLKVALEDY